MRPCHVDVASPVYHRNSNVTEVVMDATRIESSIRRLVVCGNVHFSNVSSATTHTATVLPASVVSREDTREWTVELWTHQLGRAEAEAEQAAVTSPKWPLLGARLVSTLSSDLPRVRAYS